ncbi:UNVERIFIED_CONTAM: hypothetical protein Slati_2647800 [Sesamum latifolium]|uniref:Zinc knuckle CX2CX4HX4C domain-containing protein n=1 Tax=Sesamum latifolium TaxID=2727402 RepID=A0AAW2VUL9_9LAMI
MRIRVAIDITKPLKRALKIRTVLSNEQVVTFTYERLPNFCYYYGCLDHILGSCEIQFKENFIDPGENTLFGSWLRAPPLISTRGGAMNNGWRGPSMQLRRPSFQNYAATNSSLHEAQPRGQSIFGNFVQPNSLPTPTHPIQSPTIDPHSPSSSHPIIADLDIIPLPLAPLNTDPPHSNDINTQQLNTHPNASHPASRNNPSSPSTTPIIFTS